MTVNRAETAQNIRNSAAKLAADRVHPEQLANGDEQRFATSNYSMSFTKGLEHDANTGVIKFSNDYDCFRSAIDNGFADAFTTSVPASSQKERQWEAPTAGIVYELQGPDPEAVTMAPAPAMGSKELAYEMAEVYELAILRDVSLANFTGTTPGDVLDSCARLNSVDYNLDGSDGRSRKNVAGEVTPGTVFRGSSPGVLDGPYVSQFLWIGNNSLSGDFSVADGMIGYGALVINQKVPVAAETDYMVCRNDWLKVQNGANTRDNSKLFADPKKFPRRFIITPRDLATYVHDDALYEAYLNACLILLNMGTPFDPGFDSLSGQGKLFLNSLNLNGGRSFESHSREAGGFALWGGPHILTLVTEVATRGLKAVRYQKFNNHMRLRPEALAGRIEYAEALEETFKVLQCPEEDNPGKFVPGGVFGRFEQCIQKTVDAVVAHNKKRNKCKDKNTQFKLLPMAFQEGSPMHPAYGAGHATVAGACVTILKAFFDTSVVLVERDIKDEKGKVTGVEYKFDHCQAGDRAVQFVPDPTGQTLKPERADKFLTLEGELNKLAANISIGRNMAGVHYYSDYFDSVRMGEEISIGILQEQALCYPTDNFVMSLPTFDGDTIRIGRP